MPTRENAHTNRPRRMEGNPMGRITEAMSISGEGERKTGALPCLIAEELEPPAVKADGSKGLSPEEKCVVEGWVIPGLQSWRMKLRGDQTLNNFIKFLEQDPTLAPSEMREEFKKWSKKMVVEGGLLVRREERKGGKKALKLVVPTLCRLDLLAEAHDKIHRGIESTYTALQDAGYWWPQMKEDTRAYCRNCLICRVTEAGKVGKGLLIGWGLEPRRFEVLHIDFAGPLSRSKKGNSYVFSMVDRATGRNGGYARPQYEERHTIHTQHMDPEVWTAEGHCIKYWYPF